MPGLAAEGAPQLAETHHLPLVMQGLRALAADLGDPFNATETHVGAALFGPGAYAFAMLAGTGGTARGLAFCNPVLSTYQGAAIVFVSDLWVAAECRGQGMGRALLAAAAREGAARWGAKALRLTVYDDNAAALGFYLGAGFEIRHKDRAAALSGAALERLIAAG